MSFVVGAGNREAFEAALGAVRKPRTGPNPLVIYGERGSGKTFLLKEIEQRVRAGKRRNRIRYWTCHEYWTLLCDAIRNDRSEEFVSDLAGLDVLLLDDADSASGKAKLQEHIVETVGGLSTAGTLVIVAGLYAPKDVYGMTERIWRGSPRGKAVRILRPGKDQKEAIIRMRFREKGVRPPEDIVAYLTGRRDTGNLFRLDGMVNKIAAHSAIEGKQITLAVAKELVSAL